MMYNEFKPHTGAKSCGISGMELINGMAFEQLQGRNYLVMEYRSVSLPLTWTNPIWVNDEKKILMIYDLRKNCKEIIFCMFLMLHICGSSLDNTTFPPQVMRRIIKHYLIYH
ncbi:hypothetical protein AVEN_68178-1 [Araneus ventricosus]|uniref:Uncharacterized protein n=1 Tax=Araneus ventricosus TaxID=182803 RepID=A0A4Y2P2S3_ARAVE|nr:hypothetical protein AVEN_68178-1 [Araneus ventricosus]